MKLNQLAQLAAILLVVRDKLVKQLFTRLTETVIIWLSKNQDFGEVLEDVSASELSLDSSKLSWVCTL
jgi:hypothetical protein